MSSRPLGVVKVGVSNRSSRFLTGRVAQHLENGFEKVAVAELPTMAEAEVLEQDVLWLWSRHKLRRRLSADEMPQGGWTEVADDTEQARSLYRKALSAHRSGRNPREELAPAGVTATRRSGLESKLRMLVGVYVAGVSFHPASSKVGLLGRGQVDGWLKREPSNSHDRNAVQVLSQHGQLGYLPRSVASKLRETIELAGSVRVVLDVEPSDPVRLTIVSVKVD
jgi:hypothetical protein